MADLHSRCGYYIFAMWFSSIIFPRLSQPSQIGCLPYFHTWCGLSTNLECRSETCCTRLAVKYRTHIIAKFFHLGTIAQVCLAISSQLRHISTIGKNLLKGNISSICPHNMANFGPLTAEIVSFVWAPQLISTGFASWQRYCTAL